MGKLIIVLDGGIVQKIIADSDNINVTIVDYDTEGADLDELKKVRGDDAYVSAPVIEMNPGEVDFILDEIKEQDGEILKCNMCHDGEMFHQFLLYSKQEDNVFVAESVESINSIRATMMEGNPNHEGRRIVHIYNCDNCPNSQLEYHESEDAIAYAYAMNSKNTGAI